MSRAGRSVTVFGAYAFVVGLFVLLIPNVLLSILRLPATDEPWIRIIGLLVLALAGYYVACGRGEATVFMRASVAGRLFVAFGLLVVAGLSGYWAVALFALPDAAGAAWTWAALRRPAPATAGSA